MNKIPTRNKESVMGIPSRMLLGLEEGVKIPERALHIATRRHFRKAHLEENVAKLGTDL